MDRWPLGRKLASTVRAYYRQLLLGTAFVMAAGGLFVRIPPGKTIDLGLFGLSLPGFPLGWLLTGAYFLILLTVGLSLRFSWPRRRSPTTRLFLAWLTPALALNWSVQLTGGLHSPVWPGYFLLLTAAAFGPAKLRLAGGLLASVLLLEAERLAIAGGPIEGWDEWARLASYGFALALNTAVAAWLSHRNYGWALGVRQEYEKLKSSARNLVEMGMEPDEEPGGFLSRDSRQNLWVGAAMRFEERLAAILSLAAASLEVEQCGLVEMDDSGDYLILKKLHPPPREPGLPMKIPMAGGFIGSVFKGDQPLTISGLAPRSGRVAFLGEDYQLRSLAAYPVRALRVVTGVLVAGSSRTDAFKGKETLLQGFADLVAEIRLVSHGDARKEEEGRKYEALSLVSNALSSSLKESRIIETLLDETAANIGHRIGAFFTVTGEETLLLRMARGLPAEAVGKSFNSRKCLLGFVVTHRRSLSFRDISEGKRRTPVVTGLDIHCRSLMAFPLVAEERLTGIFLAADPEPGRFDSIHAHILKVLVNQAAVQLSNAALHESMEQMAITDGLTGLHNHRHFHERLAEEIARVKRHPEPLSVLILDIDHFKRINDSYGHPFGDIVLKGVAGLLISLAREVDLVARYGGEEMAILLINTDRAGAGAMARRVMEGLAKTHFPHQDREVTVSASLGSATYPGDAATPGDLVRTADEALYRSKREGRNRYTAAGAGERVKP